MFEIPVAVSCKSEQRKKLSGLKGERRLQNKDNLFKRSGSYLWFIILYLLMHTPFFQCGASMEIYPYSFLLCSTSFTSERPPQGNTGANKTLLLCSGTGGCLPLEFNHFDTICKKLSELKIFFLIAKHNALCQQTMKGLSWQTVRSVSFSWSKGNWLTVRMGPFPEEWAVM